MSAIDDHRLADEGIPQSVRHPAPEAVKSQSAEEPEQAGSETKVAEGRLWRIGGALLLCALGVASVWYFTVALANHNTHDAWDLDKRREARDWGEAQLLVSGDVGVNLGYIASARYVWLNYHTVHHLVPAVDQSHHPAIQRILIECCEEYSVPYRRYSFWRMYKEMLVTFTTARLEGQKINWRALWSADDTPHHPDQDVSRAA